MKNEERKNGLSGFSYVKMVFGVAGLLLLLAGGVFIVVRNARKVQVPSASPFLAPARVDTTMKRARQRLKRGIERLEKRLEESRQRVNRLVPHQETLFTVCSEGVKGLWEEFAKVESSQTYQTRKELLRETRRRYEKLRSLVNQFVHSVDSTLYKIGLDSLDQEFQRLISE